MRRKKTKILLFSLLLLIVIPFCVLMFIYHQVTEDAASRIQRGAINRIIASESPVYYDDGTTPIGVFFEETHRKYIKYEDIPKFFLKGLIAAEDGNFFRHRGFDHRGILRALHANIKAGKVVQGGSTLTQQTAKNIFRREKRSYLAKLKELMQAFLLEREYSKQEILEMYSNQFFVTGFGKGLSIAAQYFFNKDAKELDLVESSFIAGSVKGPNRYNPFIKKTEAEKTKTISLAKSRKDYVLSNMYKMKFITKEQYENARSREVPFKEGKVTYHLNVILDYVRDQLENEFFKKVLLDQGVENVATSGIKIYTSINEEIQEKSLKSLRARLPLLDVELSGYDLESLPSEKYKTVGKKLNKSDTGLPFLARITHIDSDREIGHLVVAWDQGGGIIDYEGLTPLGKAWLRWKVGKKAVFGKEHVSLFLKNFNEGDLVPIQKVSSSDKGKTTLILSQFPELDGGVIVLRRGKIKAMIGGFLDRFFNRTVDARRQLGSIFKPIVFAAAQQLKWNNLDPLCNRRDVFHFENTYYYPKPDHEPKSEEVSLAWAGVKSENLASVWLLYHLTDHLNFSEFREVADTVGLCRKVEETYLEYKKRIRDKNGVVVNKSTLMEAAFEQAKKDVETDIIFSGHEKALKKLDTLNFNLDTSKLKVNKEIKIKILNRNFKVLLDLNQTMKKKFRALQDFSKQPKENENFQVFETLSRLLTNFYRTEIDGTHEKVIYSENYDYATKDNLLPVTPDWFITNSTIFNPGSVWIGDIVPSEVLDLLQEHTTKNYRGFLITNRYDLKILYKIRDFKSLVNMKYLTYLSQRLGISTKLDPVLSFPLGPNSISILEAAVVYQTFMTGKKYMASEKDPLLVPIITKIADRDDGILWEYKEKTKRILSKKTCFSVTEILRKVMKFGTGSRANDTVKVLFDEDEEQLELPVPTYGKTGTANRFTNSSFVGFIPAPGDEGNELDLEDGFVIAAYVGYDDNRPMKGRHVAIYGASGALPLWIDTANAIVNNINYKGKLEPADLAFGVLEVPTPDQYEYNLVNVSPIDGLPLGDDASELDRKLAPKIMARAERKRGVWQLNRSFQPLKRDLQ